MNWTSESLARRLGGDEKLARELVEIFLADHQALVEELRANVERGDRTAIRRSAHALKGSVANFVELGPTVTARALEHAAEAARMDDIPPLLRQFEQEVAELAAAMRRSLEGR